MLHGNRESTITAARGGSVPVSGVPPLSKPHWHTQPHTNQHWWQDNASSHPPVHSFDLSMHQINYMSPQSTKTGIRRREYRRTGGIPPLPRSLSDTAYGQTHFGPNRHNANDRDTTPTAQGTTLGHLKQGYLDFVALVMRSPTAAKGTMHGVFNQQRCVREVYAGGLQEERGVVYEKKPNNA